MLRQAAANCRRTRLDGGSHLAAISRPSRVGTLGVLLAVVSRSPTTTILSRFSALALVIGSAATLAGGCEATTETSPPEVATDEEGTLLNLLPGQEFISNGLGVIVPNPGEGIFAEAIHEDRLHVVRVETDLAGKVRLFEEVVPVAAAGGDESIVHPGPLDVLDDESSVEFAGACSDGAYKLYGTKWKSTLEWSLNAASAPSNVGADAAETKIKGSANNITTIRNDCNIKDNVPAAHKYLGRTSKKAGITADGKCSGTDSANVVDFGDLPSGYLGLACFWYRQESGRNRTVEADLRLNKVEHKWYATKPSNCSNVFSIEQVATHEWGHAFGLGHPDGSHPNLTMGPSTGPCVNDDATLGLGDIKGLQSLYPPCKPKTCADLGWQCGSGDDGCGGTLKCASCSDGNTCSNHKCVPTCKPATCASLGAECGTASDGCGKTLNCGGCGDGEVCKNNSCEPESPVCIPKTCAAQGWECGTGSNGCTGTLNCGGCGTGEKCDEATHSCVPSGGGGGGCVPKTCDDLGWECGSGSNGCGGTLSCGSCPLLQTCNTSTHQCKLL